MANKKKKNPKGLDKESKEAKDYMEAKVSKETKETKEIILVLESSQLPDEIIARAFERLDLLVALTNNMKSRVDILNSLLQKIAYS